MKHNKVILDLLRSIRDSSLTLYEKHSELIKTLKMIDAIIKKKRAPMVTISLMDSGAEIMMDGQLIYRGSLEKGEEILDVLEQSWVKEIYIYGLFKVSEISEEMHQVPNAGRHFIPKAKPIVRVEGYTTKYKKIGNVVFKDFSLPFSIDDPAALNPQLSEGDVKQAVKKYTDKAHRLGMKVFVDFFTYRAPDRVNENNYKRTFYKELSEQENAHYRSLNDEKKREFVEAILIRPENDRFSVARLTENNQERIILVRLFSPWGTNVDQVVFNVLLPEVQDSNIDLINELLDLGADGFRADLMNWLLKKYLRAYFELLPEAQKRMFDELPEPLKRIIAKTKAGAKGIGKEIEYIAETYNEEDANELSNLGVDRFYYPEVFMEYVKIVKEGASVEGLKQKIEQILPRRKRWIIYPSTFDQIALEKLGGPRKGFAALIQALHFLGLRAMVDLTKEWIDG